MAFPTTSILDDFNRANQGPPPGPGWLTAPGFDGSGLGTLRVVSNTCKDNSGGELGGQFWSAQTGPDCEIFFTLSTIPPDGGRVDVILRAVNLAPDTVDGYMVIFTRVDANPGFLVRIYSYTDSSVSQLGGDINDTNGTISNGVKFGASVIGTTISAYVNRSGTWNLVGSRNDATYPLGGYLAISTSSNTTAIDDFGGGSVVLPSDTPFVIGGRGASW